MKVLKKGREQKGWSSEQTCTGHGNGNGGCGAKLLVEIGDVFETTSCAMGEVDCYVTFRCPCGVLTDLMGVPSHVRETARKQKHLWHNETDPREVVIEYARALVTAHQPAETEHPGTMPSAVKLLKIALEKLDASRR